MEHWQMRTEALLGPDAVQRMAKSRVLLFGVGGVGAACAEALARGGVGDITLVDPDVVCESNLNRQVVALRSNLGRYKAEAMADRIRDINPHCRVQVYCMFYGAENADSIEFSGYDYVIDAIDSVASKLLLVEKCMACGTPVVVTNEGGLSDFVSYMNADKTALYEPPVHIRGMSGDIAGYGICICAGGRPADRSGPLLRSIGRTRRSKHPR